MAQSLDLLQRNRLLEMFQSVFEFITETAFGHVPNHLLRASNLVSVLVLLGLSAASGDVQRLEQVTGIRSV